MTEPNWTEEALVAEAQQELSKKIADWWQTAEAENFLSATNRNQLSFTWEALYKDATIVRQYDAITFVRALKDDQFVPAVDQIISTDKIDKKQCIEYSLYPIAYTKKQCPWYQNHFRFVIHPEKGERLVANWLTDYVPRTGFRLRRHVAGIKYVDSNEETIGRVLLILSPSGSMVVAGTEDASFDGE